MSSRQCWVDFAVRLSLPVLTKEWKSAPILVTGSQTCSELEAVARLTVGIAPWAFLDAPVSIKASLLEKLEQVLNRAPVEQQSLIECGYLSQAFLRTPALWRDLPYKARAQFLAFLRKVRSSFRPYNNNWMLQYSLTSVFLLVYEQDRSMVNEIRAITLWYNDKYLGDGVYGNGKWYTADYYNSIVIHPALITILEFAGDAILLEELGNHIRERYLRYLSLQEKMFSETGSYPVTGRSACYRLGNFYALALGAYRGDLVYAGIVPASVRSALTSALFLMQDRMFGAGGFLVPGVTGGCISRQENYISTGSLYATAFVLLILGIPENTPFWEGPDVSWTGKRIWSGTESGEVIPDWSLEERKYHPIGSSL